MTDCASQSLRNTLDCPTTGFVSLKRIQGTACQKTPRRADAHLSFCVFAADGGGHHQGKDLRAPIPAERIGHGCTLVRLPTRLDCGALRLLTMRSSRDAVMHPLEKEGPPRNADYIRLARKCARRLRAQHPSFDSLQAGRSLP